MKAFDFSERLEKILSPDAEPEARFMDNELLKKFLEYLRSFGRTIAQTSGVFDLLHSGHFKYLELAAKYGDILVVGVDVDAWVRKRKGPDRPVRPFEERIQSLAYVRSVGILTPQEGNLHEIVCPDVLIVSESTPEQTVERGQDMKKFCGRLVVLPPQAEIHTTSMITRMNTG